MPEMKPYSPPDFKVEEKLRQKSDSRFQQIARLAVEQHKALRKKSEELKKKHSIQIAKLESAHRKEAEKIREESFQRGMEQGKSEVREAVEKAVKSLKDFSRQLMDSEREFIRNAEKQVVTLALAVAKRIIGREAVSDKDIVVHTIRESLKRVAEKTEVVVHVNPDELENILSHRKELEKTDRDLGEIKFVPDDKISPGGCVVYTKVGAVDGRIESQINEIERNFNLR